MCDYAVVSTLEPEHHLETFDNGSDAGKCAARRNTMARDNGDAIRFRVVPVKTDTASYDWMRREGRRFSDNTYKAVPWCGERWYKPNHFAHVSHDDPAKLAYTPSPEYGETDRQIRTRPGRYLTQHYSDVLTQDQIREWCAAYTKENEATRLKFATDPDTIQFVYERGPTSCMSHKADDYSSPCHPTRVYGAGDLAIAYVEHEDTDDRVTARAICWPSKKIYGRSYGDENLLKMLLKEAGYTYCGNSSQWNGAKLLRIENDDGDLVAPYFDYPNEQATDDGKFLIIDNDGDICCRNTNGLADNGGQYTCDRCEERCDETYTVNGDEAWCEACYENHSYRCNDCEDCYGGNAYITDRHGNDICESCADDYDTCVRCVEYFRSDDLEYSEVESASYCSRCATRHMERTHCGQIADSVDDCDCSECEEHRAEDAEDEDEPEEDTPAESAEPQIGLTLDAIANLNKF